MTTPRVVEGNLVVPKTAKLGVVATRFNHFIVDHLVSGALDALVRHGADEGNVTLVRVNVASDANAVAWLRSCPASAYDQRSRTSPSPRVWRVVCK